MKDRITVVFAAAQIVLRHVLGRNLPTFDRADYIPEFESKPSFRNIALI